jgi:hypothetical protein
MRVGTLRNGRVRFALAPLGVDGDGSTSPALRSVHRIAGLPVVGGRELLEHRKGPAAPKRLGEGRDSRFASARNLPETNKFRGFGQLPGFLLTKAAQRSIACLGPLEYAGKRGIRI